MAGVAARAAHCDVGDDADDLGLAARDTESSADGVLVRIERARQPIVDDRPAAAWRRPAA